MLVCWIHSSLLIAKEAVEMTLCHVSIKEKIKTESTARVLTESDCQTGTWLAIWEMGSEEGTGGLLKASVPYQERRDSALLMGWALIVLWGCLCVQLSSLPS